MTIKEEQNTIKRFREWESDYLSGSSGEKPQIGFLCMRVPFELIEAYGAIPRRIVTNNDIQSSDFSIIRNDACSFCRNVPDFLSSEKYKGLSAIIAGSCCDQMRRLMDTLNETLKIPVHFYGAPRTWGADKAYFINEMISSFEKMADELGLRLNASVLEQRMYYRNVLRKRIFELRNQNSLSAVLLHHISESPLPSETILDFLDKIDTKPANERDVRLMLVGSIPSGKELDLISEMNGQVVADATCLGDRVFNQPDLSISDPVEYLYEYYIENNLCPHRKPYAPLIDYIKELAELRQIDGIIYRSVKYCHPYGLSSTRFKKELDYPMLVIDDDLTLQALSGLRTRIGAFLEMLESRKRKRA